MNLVKIFAFFLIMGCLLFSGCITQSNKNTIQVKTFPSTLPTNNITQLTIPVITETQAVQYGKMNVSVGNYNGNFSVLIDGIVAGGVSSGKQLSLKMPKGSHLVSVCTGSTCERVNVEIGPAKTTLDFEELLETDAPQGSLSISVGNYPANLTAFIDDIKVGQVSPGKILNQTLNAGNHSVEVCMDDTCFQENINIQPSNLTFLNFEGRLKNDVSQGSLSVSLGGYNAEHLPVLIDNIWVGNVSMGEPLDLKVNLGNHTVTVCLGKVCENEDVQIKFAKRSVVDFGEQLKKDVEFPRPTIRIIQSSLSSSTMIVSVEFINPENSDHSMIATISCVYSFTDSQNFRRSDSAQSRITKSVKAGSRVTQQVSLSLTGGSNIIANNTVIIDVVIT